MTRPRPGRGAHRSRHFSRETLRRAGADGATRLVGLARSRGEHVMEAAATTRRGTRKRALFPAVAGLGALATMFGLVSQNALAVNFTSVNTAYKVYTDKISGSYGAGFLDEQQKSSGKVGVMEIGFAQASLNGLCAITTQTLPVVGSVSLLVRAGEKVDGTLDPANPTALTATNLFLSSASLTGNGDQIASMNLGQSADTVTMNGGTFPAPMSPTAGAFGLQAKTLNISKLNADSYGIDLEGSINLPNLKIQVVPGSKAYADCANLADPTP